MWNTFVHAENIFRGVRALSLPTLVTGLYIVSNFLVESLMCHVKDNRSSASKLIAQQLS